MWCKMPEVSCGLSEMIGKHGEYKNPGLCHCVVDRQEFAVYSGGAGEMVRPDGQLLPPCLTVVPGFGPFFPRSREPPPFAMERDTHYK
jgi:hypothetical protein